MDDHSNLSKLMKKNFYLTPNSIDLVDQRLKGERHYFPSAHFSYFTAMIIGADKGCHIVCIPNLFLGK